LRPNIGLSSDKEVKIWMKLIKAKCVESLKAAYMPERPGNSSTGPHIFEVGLIYTFMPHSKSWLQHMRSDGNYVFVYLEDFTKHFEIKEGDVNSIS
jgi:hypothetical protein